MHSCGRRILKAVEEGKILGHTCGQQTKCDGIASLSDPRINGNFDSCEGQNEKENIADFSRLSLTSENPATLAGAEHILTTQQYSSKQCRRDSLREFEAPLKVYNRRKSSAGRPDQNFLKPSVPIETNVGSSNDDFVMPTTIPPKHQASSCQAIRNALATLYNIEDFNMAKIGEGFFSEVFKVC